MSYGLTVVTPPTSEPLSCESIKQWLRIDVGDNGQDAVIDSCIVAAREYAERYTGKALITTRYKATWDYFPADGVFELPRPPLQAVVSIVYTDVDAVPTTLATTEYDVDIKTVPGRVIQSYAGTWPTDDLIPGGVAITFDAGFGGAELVPETIKQAMRLLVGFDFANREPTKAEMQRVHDLLRINWDGTYR